MNNFLKITFSFCAFFSLAFSTNIVSQEIEEVVVTATKKEESIQDLAISIEAFTAESMEENMIEDASDLQEVVPGLIIDKGIGSGASYAIRGTGSYGVGAAVVGAVVVSTNGHDAGTSSFADIGFFDVERVEVLKGPQGTLFGRNAVVGVINTVTKRPTSELEGSWDVTMGDYDAVTSEFMLNVPVSDTISARLAYTSVDRDGFSTNIRDNKKFNDKHAYGARLSVDFDVSEKTRIMLTADMYKTDDNRNNIGAPFCESHGLLGCNPLTQGSPNVPADSRGSTAALFNVVAGLKQSAYSNSYAGMPTPDNFREAYLTRRPEQNSEYNFSQLHLEHDISDELMLSAKVSYQKRFYYHMNDNDYSHTTAPLPGILNAQLGALIPSIEWMGTFGGNFNGNEYGFTELITGDRTYEFSHSDFFSTQAEINIISSFDGPMNYTAGIYMYDGRNHNRYQVQTAAWNMTGNFSQHPYGAALYGGAFNAYGGIPFYQTWVLGGLSGSAVCASGLLGPVAAAVPATVNPACLGGLLAAQGIAPYHIPTTISGYLNDDHVRTKSTAVYGELYYDLSEDTMLTVGYRWNDDVVKDTLMTCLTDFDCPLYPASQWATGEYGFHPNYEVIANDATAYKVSVKHNISDNRMVYASYTTANKAGGSNPVIGLIPDPYDPEETGVFEIGTKSILFDGAMLFNATFFMNDTKGMLISNIENAGSVNYNVDAEITGFEGNLIAYLGESTSLDMSWLLVESELGEATMPDPINPGGIVALLDVNPALFIPGVGCATATGMCPPTAFGGGVDGLPFDPAGAVQYGYGVDSAGNIIPLFKSAGYLCTAPFNPLGGVSCPVAPAQLSLSGNSVPQSPESSYSIGVNQDFATGNGMVTARLAYRYQGEREGNVFNQDRARMPETDYMDMNITYTPNDGDWYVRVYAKNLNDDQYVGTWAASSALQGGAQFATYTDPRTWGIQFGSKF